MFGDHGLLALSEWLRDDASDPPPDASDSLLDHIAELADLPIDSPEAIFAQLFDLLRQLCDSHPRDPIHDFLSGIGFWVLIEEGLAAPLTPVVQLALKGLMTVHHLCPDVVSGFVIAHDTLLVRLLQAPDLVLPTLTLLLLALDADPAFAPRLAVRYLVRRLCAIVDGASDVVLTGAALTMISELIRRTDPREFPDAPCCRALLAAHLGPGTASAPEILVPAMRIQAAMVAAFGDVPECAVLDRMMQFVCDGRPNVIYVEALRLWNCLFCHDAADVPRATRLLDALLHQLARGPRLKILFLMANMCAYPDVAAHFIRTPALERMWRCFDTLTCAEKENCLIMIAQICISHPIEAFPRCRDFIQTVFDFTHSARRADLPLCFLIALANLARDDPARQADVDFAAIIDGLADLASTCESEAVAAAAQDVLDAYIY
jgi:hypothetical protein